MTDEQIKECKNLVFIQQLHACSVSQTHTLPVYPITRTKS